MTSFALVVHELATNAAKYGALSIDTGTVHIRWSCLKDVLVLQWLESGGPPVAGPPKATGFGTVLAGHSVRGQFGGSVTYGWNVDGVTVDLSIPMERLSK